jgi:phosphatidate cytidylyltransferase
MISLAISSFVLFCFGYDIFISIIFSSTLFFGDIFFSFIKRKLYIKDFSKILSSHGGILDRLDSMYFVVPLFYTFNLL